MGILLLDSSVSLPVLRSAEVYEGMLKDLLPPGKLWRLAASSILSKLLAACADELVRVDDRGLVLIEESDPSTTLELLPEFESELGLATVLSDSLDERRARVVARHVQRARFRPSDFQSALAVLLGQDAVDVVVIEQSQAFAASIGDAREIFRFFVYRDPSLPGAYFLESAQAMVDLMKPSHTIGHVIESIDFLADDPFSLTDRDILGA